MDIIIQHITAYSKFGDDRYPNKVDIKIDDSKPDCPITFWIGKKPMFSLGSEEVAAFCERLKSIDAS